MAQEYRQNWDETGNVIDPSMWLEDNNVLAGEFNGGLDRDNIANNSIVAGDLPTAAIHVIRGGGASNNSNTGYTPDRKLTDWQGGAGTGASGINLLTWTSGQDAHYDIHSSVYWSWNGAFSRVSAGTAANRPTDANPWTDTYDTVMFRITVNGVIVATAGPFDDGMEYDSVYMVGAIQLPAGTHTARVECLICRRIFQSGEVDGICTNTLTVNARAFAMLERRR